MSILSQIGIFGLIIFIAVILFRSNKILEEESKKGEQFVDEWEMRQRKKEERAIEKEERKEQKAVKAEERRQKKISKKENNENRIIEKEQKTEYASGWEYEEEWEPDSENDWEAKEYTGEENRAEAESGYGGAKIVPMNQYKNAELTLVQLDEKRQPVRRIRVTKLPFTIGRSQENMLVLDDLCVARKHCQIISEDGALVLKDVGTANKLFANGAVTDRVTLSDKLTLYVGNVEFKVEMGTEKSRRTQFYQNTGEKYYE